jgi:hypothetical protein
MGDDVRKQDTLDDKNSFYEKQKNKQNNGILSTNFFRCFQL